MLRNNIGIGLEVFTVETLLSAENILGIPELDRQFCSGVFCG
jgi:hypothetical protein